MNQSDLSRNSYMLSGPLAQKGYMRFWHSFYGTDPLSGDKRSFFIEIYIINPALEPDKPILGLRSKNRRGGVMSSYVAVRAGSLSDEEHEGIQIVNYYPVSALKYAKDPLYLGLGDVVVTESALSGSVYASEDEASVKSLLTDAGSMEWDLELHKAVSFNIGPFGNPLFNIFNVLESYYHAEGMRSFLKGGVTLNGITYLVTPDSGHGYSDKHWGRFYNRPWLQFFSSSIFSEKSDKVLRHSALAINGCCPRFFKLPLKKKLLIQFTYMGEDFEFNFLRPSLYSRVKWKFTPKDKTFAWHINAVNKNAVLKLVIYVKKDSPEKLLYEETGAVPTVCAPLACSDAYGRAELFRRMRGGLLYLDTLKLYDITAIFTDFKE